MGNTEELSDRVKRLRKKAGFSQSALATQAKLSVQMIKDIEAGRRGGSVDTLRRLSDAFGISLQEIATGSEDIEPNVIRTENFPASVVIQKMSLIPDEVYELAPDISEEAWGMVKVIMRREAKKSRRSSNTKQA